MQSEYDKSVVALSGGAIGLSFIFLRDVVKDATIQDTVWLLAAWTSWGISVISILFSFLTSAIALRKAIQQTDNKMIYIHQVGGRWNTITYMLNFFAGILFLAGIICIVQFVRGNMP